MGIEVVWVRQYTPYLGTVVYAFASILALYLASTFLGSHFYRYWSRSYRKLGSMVWPSLGFLGVISLFSADPQVGLAGFWRLTLGIVPFSALLGFLTPMLVDRWSGGDPNRAGYAYAINIIGCILGPLVSGFLLLPAMSERWVWALFALPWFGLGALPGLSPEPPRLAPRRLGSLSGSAALAVLAGVVVLGSKPFEEHYQPRQVLRDNTATIVATGEGMQKRLLVNGVGMTSLSPITKMMAHLPLAYLAHPPQNALAICFGMGTTFRSFLSWKIPTTAVELIPSVPRMFGYFHSDGPQLLRSPLSSIVIDDGRRYLERTAVAYDVISVDPPPPIEAAGSSLLYSKEFYLLVKARMRPQGILQQWLPSDDAVVRAAIARALKESFPYVRGFRSVEGWGYHFLASDHPFHDMGARELAEALPAAAAEDMIEWDPETTPELQFAAVLKNEVSLDQMIRQQPEIPALLDDQPLNEYYAIRRIWPTTDQHK